MQKISATVVGFILSVGTAAAADMPDLRRPYPAPAALYNWTGLYFGAHVGGGFGSSSFSDPAGPGIYGGNVRTPTGLAGVQVGFNWQVPNANWVLGVEADISAMNAAGTNTCLASSGMFFSANCAVRQNALGSLTGRAGFATGPAGRTLLYAKGGAAWLSEQIDITSNIPVDSGLSTPVASLDGSRWGWTVGAGVEQALAPAWSVKMEYDYASFGSVDAPTPASLVERVPGSPFVWSTAPGTTSTSQNIHTFKVGLNMKFGQDTDARWEGLQDYHLRGSQAADESNPIGEIEIGSRVWYSSGRFQKDLGSSVDQAQSNILVSRLTYENTAASGEVFGRIDGVSNIFVKGFLGGGSLLSGKLHDEDWGIGNGFNLIPYSNTLSDPVKGTIGYGTGDIGYNFLRGPGFKVGGFVGYNYYSENKSAYGCRQIANQLSDCVPSIPGSVLGITENNKWNSVRIGLNGVVTLWDRVQLTGDAAYLPYVSFDGVDNHLLRADQASTISPEGGKGQGVQLEAILSYSVTPALNVGAGGRYWAMWATTDAATDAFSLGCPCQTLPARTERYGGFLQASYKLDGLK
jgi:opacity protein-like surface antigen